MPQIEPATRDRTTVIDSADGRQAAFHDLRMLGFRLDEGSLLARREILEEKLG